MGIHIKASKKNLQEATALSLRGKLNEVYTKEYIETFNELYDSSWGPALQVLDKVSEADLEDDLMDWLEDLGTEDNPIDRTELNDYIIFQSEDLYDALGLDENGDQLDESKKLEARSHKEDNEKAAPRGDFEKEPRYVKNSPYDEPDVPKRAKIGNRKPDKSGSVWGVVDKDLIDTYEKSTPDIERYKEYKANAERERDNAKYYNALAKQSDDRASEIVRDRIAKSKANRKEEVKKIEDKNIDEKTLEIQMNLKDKTYQEWFDEMKNKYGLVYQYTTILGPKNAPVGKIYVFKDDEDYNYAITNGKEFNRLYDDGKLTIKGKKDTVKKAEARSRKEDNEKVAPKTITKKAEMKNDVEVKCIKTYIEDTEEYWSKGNYYQAKKLPNNEWKIKTNLGTWGRIGDAYMINDINEYFIVSPNQEYKEHKKTHNKVTRGNKKVNEGIFNKKQKDKKQSTILDDHPELVDLFKTKDMSRLGRAGWEPSKQEKTERHKTEAKLTENRELTQNNAELMCEYIADLFTNESEDLYSNFESFTDWCEGGDVFRNADFPEDKCRELDKMLKEIAPLVDEVSNILYKYVDKD